MAQKSFTVTVAGGGSATDSISGVPNWTLVNRVSVTPSASGDQFQVQFFTDGGHTAANLAYDTGLVSGTFVDPVKDASGTVTTFETTPGLVCVLKDSDATGEWHVKVINSDSSSRTFTIVIDFEGGVLELEDGVSVPATIAGSAQIYVDAADGDLKVTFGDGHTVTLAADS